MSIRSLFEFYQMCFTVESHGQQRLAWDDAAQARIARSIAEARAAAQLQAMLDANPSGSLGDAALNDEEALKRSGLL